MSGCPDPKEPYKQAGPAFTCTSNAAWAVNENLAYGTAATQIPDSCCKCYQLTFKNTAIAGKKMIVQATNTGGDLLTNHFDILLPGGGVGLFNGCSSQWGAPLDGWGKREGGISRQDECNQLPGPLRPGCIFRFQWFKNADNPAVDFVEVTCPVELTNVTGCKRK